MRDIFELDDERLLLVASDRISVFDVVLPTEIPDKGRVLTGLSAFWFARTQTIVPNHLLGAARDGRSTECRRLEMLPIECVVRGYLAGSGWKDYQATGATSGHALPEGMQESERLPEPIFTPATKAQEGHDENIDREAAAELVGVELLAEVERVCDRALQLRAEHAAARGIILADTKFEFGQDADGRLVLADEALTPDSSRFWPADEYEPGGRSRRSTSSSCATTARRSAGTRPPPAPSSRARSSQARARATSRRSSASRESRSTRTSPTRSVRARDEGDRARPAEGGHPRSAGRGSRGSLGHLGFAVGEARVGRVIDLELDAREPREARAAVERMCEQLLANPLIESYEIAIARKGRRVSERSRGPAIAVVVFPGSNDDRDAAWRSARSARRRCSSGTATRSCRSSTQSSCRAASRTATTCAAERSRASRR